MKLSTWQSDETNPTVAYIDPRRAGSYYDIFEKFRPAFERLWERVGTDQLLWCFVDENEARSSTWNGRNLWCLEVTEERILAFIDPGVWELILGSNAVPPHYDEVRDVWAGEAIRNRVPIADYVEQRLSEYHNTPAPQSDWWLDLFLDGPDDRGWTSDWVSQVIGNDVIVGSEALVKRPVEESYLVKT